MTVPSTFFAEVLHGLSLPQKALSPKWLYDDRGSELFEAITRVDEYYPTRTEQVIFKTAFPQLRTKLGDNIGIAEYGSGASVKTRALIETLEPSVYAPLDIAAEFLASAAATLAADYPNVTVLPVVADFTKPVTLPNELHACATRLGFFPGSTLGNMPPEAALQFMAEAKKTLGDGGYFLLGVDLIKDREILERAYDDRSGVTAAFNLNLLNRMNRELGANFDIRAFKHRAIWNETNACIEMHLVSMQAQFVTIQDSVFSFTKGETIHTESSHKFTVNSIEQIAQQAGWSLDSYWTDPKDWFGVFLMR